MHLSPTSKLGYLSFKTNNLDFKTGYYISRKVVQQRIIVILTIDNLTKLMLKLIIDYEK